MAELCRTFTPTEADACATCGFPRLLHPDANSINSSEDVKPTDLELNRRKDDKYRRLRGIIKQLEQEIDTLTQA